MELMEAKRRGTEELLHTLHTVKIPASSERDVWMIEKQQPVTNATYTAEELLRRPEIDYDSLCQLCPEIANAAPNVRL